MGLSSPKRHPACVVGLKAEHRKANLMFLVTMVLVLVVLTICPPIALLARSQAKSRKK